MKINVRAQVQNILSHLSDCSWKFIWEGKVRELLFHGRLPDKILQFQSSLNVFPLQEDE